jgi:hypothetical protein
MSQDDTRRELRSLVLLVGSGVMLGVLSVLANVGRLPFAVTVSKFLGNEWPWVAAVFLAGLAGTTWAAAALRGAVMVLPALLVYYALLAGFQTCWGTGCSGVIDPGVASTLMALAVFSVAGLALSAVTGLLAVGSHRQGIVGLASRLAVPAFLLHSSASTHHNLQMSPGTDPAGRQVSLLVAWACAATIAAILLHGTAQSISRRPPGGERRAGDDSTPAVDSPGPGYSR